MVFVDHAAEYLVALDQAVEGQGGWPVLVVGAHWSRAWCGR